MAEYGCTTEDIFLGYLVHPRPVDNEKGRVCAQTREYLNNIKVRGIAVQRKNSEVSARKRDASSKMHQFPIPLFLNKSSCGASDKGVLRSHARDIAWQSGLTYRPKQGHNHGAS